MSITVGLVTAQLQHSSLVKTAFKDLFSKIPNIQRELLTIVTMLYLTSPWCISNSKFVSFDSLHPCHPPAMLLTTTGRVICIYTISSVIWDFMSFWCISLSITPSRFIHAVVNAKTSPLFCILSNISLHTYVISSLSIHPLMDIPVASTPMSWLLWKHCNEHGNEGIFLS